jgi:CelD/BcsL family acetyltransferase involved in cellulose biosynthesis
MGAFPGRSSDRVQVSKMNDADALSVLRLGSREALRASAEPWDDLWRRSHVTVPTARAELVAQWVECFQPQAAFEAIVLCRRSQFLAALPLVSCRRGGWIESWDLPGNEWSPAGALLLDPQADPDQIAQRLVAEMARLPTALFWFDAVGVDDPGWPSLLAAANRADFETDVFHRWDSGWIDVCREEAFPAAGCAKNFRKKTRKAIRELSAAGALQLRVERPRDDSEARDLLADAWQIEHAGWKGRAGTSVRSRREIRRFYEQQACQLARWGQLTLAFLDLDDVPIAFEYAWWAKSVHHAMKVGYQERFARYSPGQVLVHQLLERFRESGECESVDVIGILDDAIGCWRPRRRRLARLLLAPRGWLNRSVVVASRRLLPPVRSWRDRLLAR